MGLWVYWYMSGMVDGWVGMWSDELADRWKEEF
jgi:hypothetical protein